MKLAIPRTLGALLLFASSCAPGTGPVQITALTVPKDDCTAPKVGDFLSGAGALNIGVGNPAYVLGIIATSYLDTTGTGGTLVVGGTTLESAGRESVTIDKMTIRYTSTPEIGPFPTAAFKLYINMGQGTTASAGISVNIISNEVATALAAQAGPNFTQTTLVAHLTLSGRMTLGGDKVQTQEVDYPIVINFSDPHCIVPRTTLSCAAVGQTSLIKDQAPCCENACPVASWRTDARGAYSGCNVSVVGC